MHGISHFNGSSTGEYFSEYIDQLDNKHLEFDIFITYIP